VESHNQQKALILADEMMKDDLQAKRYGEDVGQLLDGVHLSIAEGG
jgi:hypothetical protein